MHGAHALPSSGSLYVAEWRLRIDGAEYGPVDDEQLLAMAAKGGIKPHDLILNPANDRWEKAERLRGLFTPPAGSTATARASRPGDGADASAAVAAVAHDDGPFRRVTLSFRLSSGKRWAGAALVSPVAFYLVKSAAARVHGSGGILGAVLQAAMEKFDDVRSCKLSELHETVRDAIDEKRDLDVIVVPKAAVSRVTFGFGGLKVTCGDDTFTMNPTIFTRGKTRRFLAEHGWQLDTALTPTMDPVHGEGLGRSDAEPAPEPPSFLARLGYAAVAAIIIIAIVAWKASQQGPAATFGR
jgi:hypothetical protein